MASRAIYLVQNQIVKPIRIHLLCFDIIEQCLTLVLITENLTLDDLQFPSDLLINYITTRHPELYNHPVPGHIQIRGRHESKAVQKNFVQDMKKQRRWFEIKFNHSSMLINQSRGRWRPYPVDEMAPFDQIGVRYQLMVN